MSRETRWGDSFYLQKSGFAVSVCLDCGSLVLAGHEDDHDDWHDRWDAAQEPNPWTGPPVLVEGGVKRWVSRQRLARSEPEGAEGFLPYPPDAPSAPVAAPEPEAGGWDAEPVRGAAGRHVGLAAIVPRCAWCGHTKVVHGDPWSHDGRCAARVGLYKRPFCHWTVACACDRYQATLG